MICYGASSHNLCFLVPGEDAEQVVKSCILICLSNISYWRITLTDCYTPSSLKT